MKPRGGDEMSAGGLHVVTGALGYSGKYIAKRLIAQGRRTRTLTNSIGRPNPFGADLEVHSLPFADEEALIRSLEGAEVLYNTYWVRFNHHKFSRAQAVENTFRLFAAAQKAGVKRVVHVSITNPSEESALEYFRGKAILERRLRESGLSYSILRPAVLFGEEDILVNNIAWTLRHLPLFGLFGDGSYKVQPIHVDDFAALAVKEGDTEGNRIVNGIGPETFSFRELVERIGDSIGKPRPLVSLPVWMGFAGAWLLGQLMKDVMLTRDEVQGLMDGLLHVDAPPTGSTKLTDWAMLHRTTLGIRYASELARRT